MTTAREIIARACPWGERNPTSLAVADEVIVSLAFAGFRIVGPGEVDKETVEKCAALCEQPRTFIDGTAAVLPSGRAYATAIRALAEEKRP